MFPARARQIRVFGDPAAAIEAINDGALADAVVRWIYIAERQYKKTMFYSQDVPERGRVGTSGFAEGFHTTFMHFTPTLAPSKAIQRFFDGTDTICECHSLMLAVFYRAILDVIGTDLFDLAFPDLKLEPGTFWSMSTNPLKNVMADFTVKSDEAGIVKGDWVYFVNRSDYKTRHPFGAAGGWNVVCVSTDGSRRYLGFGLTELGSEPSPLTAGELCTVLQQFHDETPTNKQEGRNLGIHVDVEALMRRSGGGSNVPHLDTSVKGRRLSAAKLRTLLQKLVDSKSFAERRELVLKRN